MFVIDFTKLRDDCELLEHSVFYVNEKDFYRIKAITNHSQLPSNRTVSDIDYINEVLKEYGFDEAFKR